MQQQQQHQETLPPHSTNVEEELGRIRLALQAVYAQTTANDTNWLNQRHTADRYLTSFQRHSIAWMVCDRLLREDGNSNDSFFAAQTLHTKVRTQVDQLPDASLPSLRDSVLQHLQTLAATASGSNHALITRLALVIAALAVQLPWPTVVQDLLQHPDKTMAWHILRVLPEECASPRLYPRDESFRFTMRDQLIAAAPLLLQQLEQATNPHWSMLLEWIRFVPLRPETLQASSLPSRAVQVLVQAATDSNIDESILEPVTDVLVEVLRLYPSRQRGNEGLVQHMIHLLAPLPLQQVLQQRKMETDDTVLTCYSRVLTELGEAYVSIWTGPHYTHYTSIVSLLLQCTMLGHEYASMTLQFWYCFVLELDDLEPYSFRQTVIDGYTDCLLGLVDACGSHIMVYDEEKSWDEMRHYRMTVSETLEDCCRLLGGTVVLERLASHLQQLEIQQHPNHWHLMESHLACLCALCPFVPADEATVLPRVFALLSQLLNSGNSGIPLQQTVIKFIGKYAAWLGRPEHTRTILQSSLLPAVAQGLRHPNLAPTAAVALRELCDKVALAEPVLELYETAVVGHVDVATVELPVLEGVCRSLTRVITTPSAEQPTDGGLAFLQRLTEPMGHRLAAAATAAPSSDAKAAILAEMDRLALVVQHLKVWIPNPGPQQQQHPTVVLMQSCWPLLDKVTTQLYSFDFDLAERACRLHKYSMRSCGTAAYTPLVEPLLQQVVKTFQQSHQSPYLYLASICVTEYAATTSTDQDFRPHLYQAVAALASTVFSFVRNAEEMTNHPDVVEELCYLMGRMMTYLPEPVLSNGPLLSSLLQFAITAMQVEHRGANKGTLQFLEDLISNGLTIKNDQHQNAAAATSLHQVLEKQGPMVVANMTRGIMGDLPCFHDRQIPLLLWKLQQLIGPHMFSSWLQSAVDGSNTTVQEAKLTFVRTVSSTGLAKEDVSSAVRAFQSACYRERRLCLQQT